MFAVIAQLPAAPARTDEPYWKLSRGPLASLVFIAPLLAMYELGVLRLGPQAIRNGADVWLRGLLDALGFGQYFLLPLATVATLLAWHHLSGERWRLPLGVFGGMSLECLALAGALVVLAQMQGSLLRTVGIPTDPPRSVARASAPSWQSTTLDHAAAQSPSPLAVGSARASKLSRLIAYLGAGIYEEVLFRLMLLPLCILVLKRCGMNGGNSVLWAIAITSVIFSAAHYIGPHGDRWHTVSFAFRTLAGGFFAVLFVHRGFGITAGAHAGYDILVGLN